MFKLTKATGARMVNNLDDLSNKDLGSADLVEERKVETDKWVFIEGCKNPKAVTILIRGGSQRVVDEADRSVHYALMVTKDVIEKPAIVAGGGAPEASRRRRGHRQPARKRRVLRRDCAPARRHAEGDRPCCGGRPGRCDGARPGDVRAARA